MSGSVPGTTVASSVAAWARRVGPRRHDLSHTGIEFRSCAGNGGDAFAPGIELDFAAADDDCDGMCDEFVLLTPHEMTVRRIGPRDGKAIVRFLRLDFSPKAAP